MATMNISLPDALKQFVDEEIAEGSFASASDYMRDLIRQRQRQKYEDKLRQALYDGLNSGPAIIQDEQFFDRIREEIRQRAEQRAIAE